MSKCKECIYHGSYWSDEIYGSFKEEACYFETTPTNRNSSDPACRHFKKTGANVCQDVSTHTFEELKIFVSSDNYNTIKNHFGGGVPSWIVLDEHVKTKG